MSDFQINTQLFRSGFLCLVGCVLLVTLSVTVVPGDWTVIVLLFAVFLGVMSGGLSAASITRRT